MSLRRSLRLLWTLLFGICLVLQVIASPGRSSTGPILESPIICPTSLRSTRWLGSRLSPLTPSRWRPWLPKARDSSLPPLFLLVYHQVSVQMYGWAIGIECPSVPKGRPISVDVKLWTRQAKREANVQLSVAAVPQMATCCWHEKKPIPFISNFKMASNAEIKPRFKASC